MAQLKNIQHLAPAAALLLPLLLSACGPKGFDTAGFAGAASMQIDVEVYKGPLSKELKVQKSELFAKVNESQVALIELVGQTRIAMCALACFDRRAGRPSHKLYPVEEYNLGDDFPLYRRPQFLAPPKWTRRHKGAKDFCARRIHDIEIETSADEKHDVCPVLANMENDLTGIKAQGVEAKLYHLELVYGEDRQKAKQPTKCKEIGGNVYGCQTGVSYDGAFKMMNDRKTALPYILKAASYAEVLRSRAAFVATQQTAIEPKSKRARRVIANYAQFLADYGNQIGARADAILKQEALFEAGDPDVYDERTLLARELLANTSYLRDSAPTGFLNLYKFNDASAENTRRGATERIRLVEQLTADTYWTRINSVFAAGQGNVTMAFVKDDIGNWDLKKFDNQPGELVDAYKDAGVALLGEIAGLATGAGGIEGASQLLSFADRLNFGGGAASNAQVDVQVAQLRQRTAARLEALKTSEQKRYDALTESIGKATETVAETNTEVEGLMAAAVTSMGDLDDAKAGLKQESEALAALQGEKRGLEDALAGAADDQRQPIQEKISVVDAKIANQAQRVELAEELVALRDERDDANQTALAAGTDKLEEQKAALAALNAQKAVLPAETARAARQILDSYLSTLEELAQASAGAPVAGAAAPAAAEAAVAARTPAPLTLSETPETPATGSSTESDVPATEGVPITVDVPVAASEGAVTGGQGESPLPAAPDEEALTLDAVPQAPNASPVTDVEGPVDLDN